MNALLQNYRGLLAALSYVVYMLPLAYCFFILGMAMGLKGALVGALVFGPPYLALAWVIYRLGWKSPNEPVLSGRKRKPVAVILAVGIVVSLACLVVPYIAGASNESIAYAVMSLIGFASLPAVSIAGCTLVVTWRRHRSIEDAPNSAIDTDAAASPLRAPHGAGHRGR